MQTKPDKLQVTLTGRYGLAFNPFATDLRTSAMFITSAAESFCWRVTYQLEEGGFVLLLGEPGVGKSVTLRILASTLSVIREVNVAVLTRPQASVFDFYRELGSLFSADIKPSNRWRATQELRAQFVKHIETTLYRPVILIDEAQEMSAQVMRELRLLGTMALDARNLLTIVLSGDFRLQELLKTASFAPVYSRCRTRLVLEPATPEQLEEVLRHLLKGAGNPELMTDGLIRTICEHAAGNLRSLMQIGHSLLVTAVEKKVQVIDEKLFFDVFHKSPKRLPSAASK